MGAVAFPRILVVDVNVPINRPADGGVNVREIWQICAM
jgi:hypothetical protein